VPPIATEEIPKRHLRRAARRAVGPLLATPAFARGRSRVRRLDLAAITRRMAAIAREEGVPPLLALAVGLAETGLRNVDAPGNPGRGWFQMTTEGAPYVTSSRPPTDAEAHDLEYAAREFCRAAAAHEHVHPGLRRDLWQWAVVTQGVENALHRNRPYGPRDFATFLYEASGLLAAYDG
jgi:hypothetical protein